LTDINLFLALGAGFLSFISPCCLPLYPAFLSYITGMSLEEMKKESVLLHKKSFLHTILFLVGFSVIFIAMAYGTSFIGSFFYLYKEEIRRIGAIVIFLFGLIILGVIRPGFLLKEHRYSFKNRPSGFFGTFLIGMSFAAGWTPCNGPILGAVLTLAGTNPESSFLYMGSYILGFSIPFLLLTFFIGGTKKFKKYNQLWMNIGGGMMLLMGGVLYFDGMTWINSLLSPFFGGFTGF